MAMRSALALLLAGIALVAAQPAAAGVIAGSKHDFSTQKWTLNSQICVVCHTPHNGDTTTPGAPALWNHANSTASYTLYTSPTMNAVTAQPGQSSKLCLSCHDGTVAVDSFGGNTGTTFITNPATGSYKPNMGTTLLDDHPIGFTYDTTLSNADGSLFDPASKIVTIGSTPSKSGTIAATLLYGGKMECSSCHDVHNTFTVGTSGMVKIGTSSSALCAACHNK
jgi:hypothetical protein